MRIFGLYFSGTGNTKWVSEQVQEKLSHKHEVEVISIEGLSVESAHKEMKKADLFMLLYPAYGNDMPEILSNYLNELVKWGPLEDLGVISIVVPALYAADGVLAGNEQYNQLKMNQLGGYHVFMSCNFNTPIPGFNIASDKKQNKLLGEAEKKIEQIVRDINYKSFSFEKTGDFHRFLGKLENKPNKKAMGKYDVKINHSLCIKCGKCIKLCPTQNLEFQSDELTVKGKCTICLRCINACPSCAIRIFSAKGKRPYKQYKGPMIKI